MMDDFSCFWIDNFFFIKIIISINHALFIHPFTIRYSLVRSNHEFLSDLLFAGQRRIDNFPIKTIFYRKPDIFKNSQINI